MSQHAPRAEVNIPPRARRQNRLLLDQATLYADATTFQKVMDWMDTAATPTEAAGMRLFVQSQSPWKGE